MVIPVPGPILHVYDFVCVLNRRDVHRRKLNNYNISISALFNTYCRHSYSLHYKDEGLMSFLVYI